MKKNVINLQRKRLFKIKLCSAKQKRKKESNEWWWGIYRRTCEETKMLCSCQTLIKSFFFTLVIRFLLSVVEDVSFLMMKNISPGSWILDNNYLKRSVFFIHFNPGKMFLLNNNSNIGKKNITSNNTSSIVK